MTASGSGTGTPVIGGSQGIGISGPIGTGGGSCVSLPAYTELIDYDENRFWGVYKDDSPDYGCREFWTRRERRNIAKYLRVAQTMIERELHFPLCPTWIEAEARPYSPAILTRKKWIISGGVQASEVIELEATVDHSSDPAVIGPIATTVTDTSEVVVYHTGTNQAIVPEMVAIDSDTGELTIEIPRCRLVLPEVEKQTTPEQGIHYDQLANFAETVDVVRIYNDPSQQATLVWPHRCTSSCSTNGCTEQTQASCIYIEDPEIGRISVQPATYINGAWKRAKTNCRGVPVTVRLNYLAGVPHELEDMHDAVVRLAHSLMPEEPCGCKIIREMWKRDRDMPLALTRERENCPFGMSNGAWIAYQFARANAVLGMGTTG